VYAWKLEHVENLRSVIDGNVVAVVGKATQAPSTIWATLARDVLTSSAVSPPYVPAVSNPWTLHFCTQLDHIPEPIRFMWMRWKKIQKMAINFKTPETTFDLMTTPVMYHPLLGKKTGSGDAKKFNSELWRALWDGGVRVFGDIWDPVQQRPIVPPNLPSVKSYSYAVSGIKRLIPSALPETWRGLIEAPSCEWTPGEKPRKEFFLGSKEKPIYLEDVNFRKAYKLILAGKLQSTNFTDRIEGPILAYQRRFGQRVTADRMWAAARNKFGTPRIGDLLWRLLHKKVRTGTDLAWMPLARQLCPIHNVDHSIEHIWLSCTVSKAVWEEFATIWGRLSPTPAAETVTINEMIAFMALSPKLNGIQRRRWDILYQTAIWSLWKCYLSHSFDDPIKYWEPEAARSYYRILVRKQILTDRVLCLHERYRTKDYSEKMFNSLWGELPNMLKVRKGPLCLRAAAPGIGTTMSSNNRRATEVTEAPEAPDGNSEWVTVGGDEWNRLLRLPRTVAPNRS